MRFTKATSLLSAVALVSANTVTFESLDSIVRIVHFTPSAGASSDTSTVTVSGGDSTKVDFPQGWSGNFYAVYDGSDNQEGMLGEISFNQNGDTTFFDVSAIVNASDHNNVKELWPATSKSPVSGCEVFPCDNAYYQPNDVQTKATSETDLVCTLGSSSTSSRDAGDVDPVLRNRNFILSYREE